MRVFSSPCRLSAASILCLGTFDGMHRGHQALLSACMRPGHASAMATFLEHPAKVLAPSRAPARLQTQAQREQVCRALGLQQLVYLPFDAQVAAMSPEHFVQHFLVETLRPSSVVVGDDFRFGAQRKGDPELLGELLSLHNIDLEVVTEQCLAQGQRLSSTAVRRCIEQGDLPGAQAILGRPYALQARVLPGFARGRQLAIPTANLRPDQCLPPIGVYAGWVPGPAQDPDSLRPAVANLGHHPTFGRSDELKFEVHILDCEPDQAPDYGDTLEFHMVGRLRDEQRFESAPALQAAIAQDISRARALLNDTSRAAITVQPLS